MNRLRELRQEKKLSQKAIAEILEINEKTVSRWENGESQIKPEKAQQLADYFGVSVGYLLGYSEFLDRFDAIQNIKEQEKSWEYLPESKILSLVGSDGFNKIKNEYTNAQGLEPDFEKYIALLSAINALDYYDECNLLIWYASLKTETKKNVLNIIQDLANQDN